MSRKTKFKKKNTKSTALTQSLVKATEQAFQATKFCFTEGCTSLDFQQCHVLSESTQLKHLVTKSSAYVAIINAPPGKQFNSTRDNIWEFKRPPSALTFAGFCNSCDTRLFLNADKAIQLDTQLVEELNLRAFCYNSWYRIVSIKANEKILKNRGISYNNFPPLTVPKSAHISCFEDEREYLRMVIDGGIKKLLNFQLTGETTYINYAYEIHDEIQFCYSACTYLTTNIFGGVRPLDWNTSVEPPIWFIHLINIANKPHLLISFEEKYQHIVEPEIRILEELNPDELCRLLVQYFMTNNNGLVCSSDMAKEISNSSYFKKKLRKAILSSERGLNSKDHIGIPAVDLYSGKLTLGTKILVK